MEQLNIRDSKADKQWHIVSFWYADSYFSKISFIALGFKIYTFFLCLAMEVLNYLDGGKGEFVVGPAERWNLVFYYVDST